MGRTIAPGYFFCVLGKNARFPFNGIYSVRTTVTAEPRLSLTSNSSGHFSSLNCLFFKPYLLRLFLSHTVDPDKG